MRVTSLTLKNFRSFVDSGPIVLDQINVLIGANNAGKSTVLRGLHHLQDGLGDMFADVRVGVREALVEINLANVKDMDGWVNSDPGKSLTFSARILSADRKNGNIENMLAQASTTRRPAQEPHHFIVPFLSKRKVSGYHEDVREQNVISVDGTAVTLAAKLSRLGNPSYPFHESYSSACKSILGFVVTAISSSAGQRPGVYLPDGQAIPIDQLGEGVPNIVHLLASLAVSKDKLFLVEELENDLHPQALKAVLDLIVESSSRNQFVVSTHSNIVVRHLCAASKSLLYQVQAKKDSLPVESEIIQVPNTPSARLSVLSDLGYSFTDFELWDGWLILEESSAETLIRDYLIPKFAPKLSRLRTISAGGVSKVNSLFADLHRLFLFTHLTPIYRERSWVVIDGDEVGKKTIEQLQSKFSSDYHPRFRIFSHDAFERYYPREFSADIDAALAQEDKVLRRQAKEKLLKKLIIWLDEDPDRATAALRESAAEVIRLLGEIASSIGLCDDDYPS